MIDRQLASEWKEALGFDPATKAGRNAALVDPMFSEIFSYTLPKARVVRLHVSGELGKRKRSPIGSVGSVMLFLVRGGCLAFDAGPTMHTGDVGLVSNSISLKGQARRLDVLIFLLEKTEDFSFEMTDKRQIRWSSGAEPAVKLLFDWTMTLFDALSGLEIEEACAALQMVANFARNALQNNQPQKIISLLDADAIGLVKSFIKENIADPDLSPEKISDAMRLSRSRLYQIFATAGGVEAYITGCRLDLCLFELSTLPLASRGVGKIAARYGFKSGAHFNHAFRKRFAAAPSAFFGVGAARYAEIAAEAEARWTRPPAAKRDG